MPIDDVQPMWDTPVDAQSNEVIVAIDLDQGLFIKLKLMFSALVLISGLNFYKLSKTSTVTPVSHSTGMPSGSNSQTTAMSHS